jgi:hypothetical protein
MSRKRELSTEGETFVATRGGQGGCEVGVPDESRDQCYSAIRKIPVTTELSFLPGANANALIVKAVPFTMIGAP